MSITCTSDTHLLFSLMCKHHKTPWNLVFQLQINNTSICGPQFLIPSGLSMCPHSGRSYQIFCSSGFFLCQLPAVIRTTTPKWKVTGNEHCICVLLQRLHQCECANMIWVTECGQEEKYFFFLYLELGFYGGCVNSVANPQHTFSLWR